MLIYQVVAGLNASDGGPSRTVLQASEALSVREGVEVQVLSQGLAGAKSMLPHAASVSCSLGESKRSLDLKLGVPGRKLLLRRVAQRSPNLFHLNGIWHPLSHWCARAAHRHGIPLVIQPHGMLEPWALGWRSTKKRWALAVYQRRDIDSAALLVATAQQEADNLRSLGFRSAIAVIPNGVDLCGDKIADVGEGGVSKALRHALFLSRVHPKKGLLTLLRAWAAVQPQEWVLQVAGPDEGGHLGEVMALAERLGIRDKVQYLGEVDDQAKWAVYRRADLFVLPTFSENFGVVVSEALSQGLPVITTTGAPWKDLGTYGCGWWVEPSEPGLQGALTQAFALPPERLVEMGERGRKYVQRYDWSVIAGQMLEAYRWVLGQGRLPDFVRLD